MSECLSCTAEVAINARYSCEVGCNVMNSDISKNGEYTPVRDQFKELTGERYLKRSMGRLIVHQKDGLLELDGFLLHAGDRAEIRVIGFWIPGIIAHDKKGWYFLTSGQVGIRLQTGLVAHLLLLAEK
jgi:hypothetical protein